MTSTEPTIDRLARAACDSSCDGPSWAEESEDERDAWRHVVRAILQEMRAANSATLKAGELAALDSGAGYVEAGTARDTWQAMIDAILEGK